MSYVNSKKPQNIKIHYELLFYLFFSVVFNLDADFALYMKLPQLCAEGASRLVHTLRQLYKTPARGV